MTYDFNPMVAKAIAFAIQSHIGQFRKDGKTPYITHPLAVMELLKNQNAEIRTIAVLHDVLEDSNDPQIETKLYNEFNSEIVHAIKALSHYSDETYEEYIAAIKKNDITRKVKIADICHNLSCNPSKKQVEKYLKALAFLFED